MIRGILGGDGDGITDRELVSTAAVVNVLLERSGSGLLAFDRDLRVEFSSPELSDVLGSIECGRPLESSAQHVATVAELVARVRATGEAIFEVAVDGPVVDGPVTLVASAFPITTGGEVVGVGCVVENGARDRLAVELLDATSLAIGVFEGSAHRVRLINRRWQHQLGFAGSAGAQLRDIATPAFAQRAFELLDRVYATHEHVPFSELALAARDGASPRLLAGIVAPVRSALGAVRGVMMICMDVTGDVLAHRHRLDAPPLVWSGLRGAEADYASSQWADYDGGPHGFAAVHHADRAACEAALADAQRTGGSPSDTEARLRSADGSYRWHHLSFSFDAPSDRWYATAVDDDDARRAAQRAHQTAQDDRRVSARARDRFLASVSHELRAPITTVLLWEKILRDASDDHELRTRGLDAIRQSAVLQARLVDDLLDVARATSGKLRVDLRPLDLHELLESALDDAAPSAIAKRQTIERALASDLGPVDGDIGRLRQVMQNLMSNAVKFTGDGGTIWVSARRAGDRVIVEVTDSGRGIAREFLPHIFDPFSQADDADEHGLRGLGLGLAISFQLVLAHGGQMSASSPGIGRGATFRVTLPAATADDRRAAPVRPASRLSGMHLLVVDDDRRVLDALQIILQSAGATVDVADSAGGGIVAFERARPDAVLSDLAMPDEDGYSFVRRIRGLQGAAGRIPAVAVTGHVTEADRERALAAGFDLYVTKPVNVDHLIATIEHLVETRRSGSA